MLRGGLWKFSLGETWNELWTSIFCASLLSRMPLNKVDAFHLPTCANAFHHSNKQHNQLQTGSAYSWLPSGKQISESSNLSTNYKWTDGQKLSKIPRLILARCITEAPPASVLPEMRRHSWRGAEKLFLLPRIARMTPPRGRQLGNWGKTAPPVLHSYQRLPLLRFITRLSLTKKLLNLLERNNVIIQWRS